MLITHPRATLVAAAVVGAVALAGCASGGNPASSASPQSIEVPGADAEANAYLAELYAEASEPGANKIVIYGPSASTSLDLYAAFSARFPGIEFVAQDQADSASLSKLEIEAQSGNRVADILISGGPTAAAAAQTEGICTKLEIGTAAQDDLIYSFEDKLLRYAYKPFTIIYNTDELDESEAPKTWEDLLDPKWKGKLVMNDPTVLGAERFILSAMQYPEVADKWGAPYLEQLAAQDPAYAASTQTLPSEVASGRYQVGIATFIGTYKIAKAKGAPIDVIFPMEDGGMYFSGSAVCLAEDAPHRAATELYVNWLFTNEGQAALAEHETAYGALPGAPGPNGAPTFDKLDKLPVATDAPGSNDAYFAVIDELFTKG
jgi:iron(III) transport system substrate-binding protein